MAIPNLTPLPDPPLPTDAEAIFDSKAGVSLLAQQEMVEQLNALTIPGINQAVADSTAAKNSAAGSADAAAESATAAALSAEDATENGAAQVELAHAEALAAGQQAQVAANSAQQAQNYAAAAQAAAGIPALAGNARKALAVKPDESGVEWVILSQAIGDTLLTSATPDETYLLANDAIYLKSAYPTLAAQLGSIRSRNLKTPFTSVSTALSSGIIKVAAGKDGVLIAVSSGGGAARSTDGGATWTTIPSLTGQLTAIATDHAGVWVIGRSSSQQISRSIDNGVTWSTITITSGFTYGRVRHLVTDGSGNWLMTHAGDGDTAPQGFYYRSTDNGATWARSSAIYGANTPPLAATMTKSGIAMFSSSTGGNTALYINKSAGLSGSWTLQAFDTAGMATVMPTGGMTQGLITAGPAGLFVSSDSGDTWQQRPITLPTAIDMYAADNGDLLLLGQNGVVLRSDDLETWQQVVAPGGSAVSSITQTAAGIAVVGLNGTAINRSPVTYNYDTSTQFRVPKIPSATGQNAYIKARLA